MIPQCWCVNAVNLLTKTSSLLIIVGVVAYEQNILKSISSSQTDLYELFISLSVFELKLEKRQW